MEKIKRGSQTTEHEKIALIFQDAQKTTWLTSPLKGRPWMLQAHITVQCPTASTWMKTRNAKTKM